MRSVHAAVALVVSEQLHPCFRLRLLQGRAAVKGLLGRRDQACLVDSRLRLLPWRLRLQCVLRLWRAVLELCRYHCVAFKRWTRHNYGGRHHHHHNDDDHGAGIHEHADYDGASNDQGSFGRLQGSERCGAVRCHGFQMHSSLPNAARWAVAVWPWQRMRLFRDFDHHRDHHCDHLCDHHCDHHASNKHYAEHYGRQRASVHAYAWPASKRSYTGKLCPMRGGLSVVALQHRSCHLHLLGQLLGRGVAP